MKNSKENPVEIRKKREYNLRKEYILKSARNVFIEHGYSNTTMQLISDDAGFSKPMIYQFFSTKEDLLVSLTIPWGYKLQDQLKLIKQQLEDDKYQSGRDLLHDIFHVSFELYKDDPEMHLLFNVYLMIGESWKITEDTLQKMRKSAFPNFYIAEEIFDIAMQKGLLKKWNILHLSHFFGAGIFSGFLLFLNRFLKLTGQVSSELIKEHLDAVENLMVEALVIK